MMKDVILPCFQRILGYFKAVLYFSFEVDTSLEVEGEPIGLACERTPGVDDPLPEAAVPRTVRIVL